MSRNQKESFVIHVKPGSEPTVSSPKYFNFSAMKLFDRFRRIVIRFVFGSPATAGPRRPCERFEPPKTSCSSYYSSSSHYNEAIDDCIEFFNKSAREGVLCGRRSDVMV
ncbi:hypothetical protein NMG60_11016146 [Bertholletia excelsa]